MRPFRLTELAAECLAQLKCEGITPSAQQVLDIQRLSLEAAGEELSRGKPCERGGTTFWPLTIGAAAWLADTEAVFAAIGRDARLYALAYASANAREKNAFNEYGSEAVKAVRKWRKGLRCTEQEMMDALEEITRDYLFLPGEKAEILGMRVDVEDLAISLSSLCGGNYEAWLWLVSLDSARKIIETRVAQKKAERDIAQPPKGLEASKRLARYCAALRERAQKRNGENGAQG